MSPRYYGRARRGGRSNKLTMKRYARSNVCMLKRDNSRGRNDRAIAQV